MPELQRFKGLRKKMNQEMLELLMDCLKPTNQMVKNLILVQESYINTYHPDFMGSGGSIMSMFDPNEFNKRMEEKKEKQNGNRMTFEQIEDNEGEGVSTQIDSGQNAQDHWQANPSGS